MIRSVPDVPGASAPHARTAAAAAAVIAVGAGRTLLPVPAAQTAGPAVVISNLLDLGCTVSFFLVMAALGIRILRRASVETRGPVESAVLSMTTGSALTGTVLLAVGFAGIEVVPAVAVVCLVALVVAAPALPQAAAEISAALRELAESVGVLAGLVAAAFVAFMTAMALAPPTDWDSLMYHLQVPAVLLRSGPSAAAANPHAAFIGPVQALYLPFLAAGGLAVPALLQVGYAALFGAAVVLTARRLGAATARLSVVLLWGSFVIVAVAMTPRVDVTLGLYLLVAHYLFLGSEADGTDDPRRIVLGSAMLGFAVGIKYHALVYAVALSPLVLLRIRSFERGNRARIAAFALVAVALAAAPILLKNLALFGDPVYPFLGGPRPEQWMRSLAAFQGPVPGGDAFRIYSGATSPFRLLPWFTNPAPLTPEVEGFLYRANPIFLLLPFLLVFRSRTASWIVAPAALYMALLVLIEPSGNLRYLIPVAAPFTIGSAWVLDASTRRFRAARRTVRSAAIGAAVTLVLFLPGIYVFGLLSRRDQLAWDVGAISRARYLANQMQPLGALLPRIHATVPDSARLLLFYEARGFWLRPRVIEDNYASAWPRLQERLGPNQCLPPSSADFVLVDWRAERSFLDRGVPASDLRPDRLLDFTRRCLLPVFQTEDYSLYRVPGAGGSTAPAATPDMQPAAESTR